MGGAGLAGCVSAGAWDGLGLNSGTCFAALCLNDSSAHACTQADRAVVADVFAFGDDDALHGHGRGVCATASQHAPAVHANAAREVGQIDFYAVGRRALLYHGAAAGYYAPAAVPGGVADGAGATIAAG